MPEPSAMERRSNYFSARGDMQHPDDAPEDLKQSVDTLHTQLQSIPTPRADPRGSDPGASMRDYGKYPASFPEKASALAGAIRQIWFSRKE
jgi:hypothetical protein